jgi:hypothetical protein
MKPTGPWLQYRLALGAVNGGNSPRVTSVKIEFEIWTGAVNREP